MNALANEALPLFLDKLVPSYVAVIISVSLVLFFGEIIPSAIFTGPNQLAISSKLAPFVKFILFVLAPIAWPIAKILDYFLHDDEHASLEKYNSNELSALVQLQFEDRMASKKRRKQERASLTSSLVTDVVNNGTHRSSFDEENNQTHCSVSASESHRFVNHPDILLMVDGALDMNSTKVVDVMQKWDHVYAIPNDMVLIQKNIIDIYRSGHSRIPVYQNSNDIDHNDDDGNDHDSANMNRRICGLFLSRHLAVINSQDQRVISTLPLATPLFVQPAMNMIDLLNLFQDGKGHMAIVCLNPDEAREAMDNNVAIPLSAEIVGLVTLEDCLEELIQEEIYDEYDKEEMVALERAKRAVEKWKKFVQKKKNSRAAAEATDEALDENSRLLPIE
jgi:metal transporter CNNM